MFGNLDAFRDLIAVAHKNLVLSQGWNETLFRRLAALADGKVEFRTLPVVRYDNIDGQDVNIVDPAAIRAGSPASSTGPRPPALRRRPPRIRPRKPPWPS